MSIKEETESKASLNYQCPNCGSPIAYNPDARLFSCEYCLSQFTSEEMASADQKREAEAFRRLRNSNSKDKAHSEADSHFQSYHCNNCGAEVITDENTTAAFCYYCHSPVILEEKLSGENRPEQMLAFTIGKEKAQEKFLDWTKDKRYLPEDFTSTAHLEQMAGIYIPYWYLDSDVEVNFTGTSHTEFTWRVGDYLYTEITKYLHERQGRYYFTDVNVLASNKIDINLLNGIEPFDSDQLQDFSKPMLSGFFAETFDLDKENGKNYLDQSINNLSDELLNRSFRFTTNIREEYKNFALTDKSLRNVLVPVWVLTYEYLGKIYTFAVNGSSGTASGELPVVKKKLWRDTILLGLAVFIILFIVLAFFLIKFRGA